MPDLEVGDCVVLKIKVGCFPPGSRENDLNYYTINTLRTRVRAVCETSGLADIYFDIDGVTLPSENTHYVCTKETWLDRNREVLTGIFVNEDGTTSEKDFEVVEIKPLELKTTCRVILESISR